MIVGVLGCGDISKEFMSASRNADVEVKAVYHREFEKASAFAESYGLERAYDDYDSFLAQEDVDTVYVGLPNSLHYPFAKKAMQAGKNVLIEKPFCSNLREFDDLVNTSKVNNVYLIEMDRVTSMPNFAIVRDRLGELGKIRACQLDFSKYSRKYDAYLAGEHVNVFDSAFSGGALADLGVYLVNFVVALFGKPHSLIYVADKLESGVDVSGVLVMKYPEMLVSITNSKNSIGDMVTTIQGEKGTFRLGTTPSVFSTVDKISKAGTERISVDQEFDGSTYTLMEMKRIIDNDDKAAGEIRLAQSRKVMEVLQSARKSAGIVFKADEA